MKKKEVPWSRIKRKSVTSEPVYATDKLKQWAKILGCLIGVTILVGSLAMFRIPERIGLISYPETSQAEISIRLTPKYKNIVEQMLDSEQELDWDGDGLNNGADPYPWDIDHDRNGIPDGKPMENFIKGELAVRYGNIEAAVSNTQSGFAYYNGKYYFCSFAGWVGISAAQGIPYIFDGINWKEAEHEYIGEKCYLNIPGDCMVAFSESGEPKSREVVLPVEEAVCSIRPDERYSAANAPLLQLSGIYSRIDSGKTVQVSILTEGGEQLLLVYRYDTAGNLLVADLESLSPNGVITITVQAQVFYSRGDITMREWFDFTWGGLSSANGDVLTVF